MNREDIMKILPHRDPFLFLDEVREVRPGVSCEAVWHLREDLPFFAGHFPGKPVTPGVLLLEAMAQAGAVAVLSVPEYAEKLALFGGADKVKFRKSVFPGDTLELRVFLDKLGRQAGKGHGECLVNGEIACQAELLFVLTEG